MKRTTIEEYRVHCMSSPELLAASVNLSIEEGFDPFGSPFLFVSVTDGEHGQRLEHHYFCQAMLRRPDA